MINWSKRSACAALRRCRQNRVATIIAALDNQAEPQYNQTELPYNQTEPLYNQSEPPYNQAQPPYNQTVPWVTFLPEGVVLGFLKFTCGLTHQKSKIGGEQIMGIF